MSFQNNRETFEKSLKKCAAMADAINFLIKPEFLNIFLSMIEEYNIHYSYDIDKLLAEVDILNNKMGFFEDHVCDLVDDIKKLESEQWAIEQELIDYKHTVLRMEQELEKHEV